MMNPSQHCSIITESQGLNIHPKKKGHTSFRVNEVAKLLIFTQEILTREKQVAEFRYIEYDAIYEVFNVVLFGSFISSESMRNIHGKDTRQSQVHNYPVEEGSAEGHKRGLQIIYVSHLGLLACGRCHTGDKYMQMFAQT